jgi:arylsulfatase A-like enzyme
LKPNFIFILADDLGYADLGCYGGRPAASGGGTGSCSPVLDRMASEGLRFTNGYANSPVCSPTRFAFATGRWQYRLRGAADEPIASRIGRGHPELGLPPSHPTLASLLRDAGYATALIGKWHLGFAPHFGPLKSGYQEFFGPMSGGVDYFRHCDSAGRHDLYRGEEEVHRTGYMTDLLSDEAVGFVQRQKGKPFLLSLHYTAPHWPWESREDAEESKRISNIAHLDGGSVQTYLTMVHHMDEGIGRVLGALDDTVRGEHVRRVHQRQRRRALLRQLAAGRRQDGLTEGGIRVPYIARWPARVPQGGTTARLAITMDWTGDLPERRRASSRTATIRWTASICSGRKSRGTSIGG